MSHKMVIHVMSYVSRMESTFARMKLKGIDGKLFLKMDLGPHQIYVAGALYDDLLP